jgi:hypothetical protein
MIRGVAKELITFQNVPQDHKIHIVGERHNDVGSIDFKRKLQALAEKKQVILLLEGKHAPSLAGNRHLLGIDNDWIKNYSAQLDTYFFCTRSIKERKSKDIDSSGNLSFDRITVDKNFSLELNFMVVSTFTLFALKAIDHGNEFFSLLQTKLSDDLEIKQLWFEFLQIVATHAANPQLIEFADTYSSVQSLPQECLTFFYMNIERWQIIQEHIIITLGEIISKYILADAIHPTLLSDTTNAAFSVGVNQNLFSMEGIKDFLQELTPDKISQIRNQLRSFIFAENTVRLCLQKLPLIKPAISRNIPIYAIIGNDHLQEVRETINNMCPEHSSLFVYHKFPDRPRLPQLDNGNSGSIDEQPRPLSDSIHKLWAEQQKDGQQELPSAVYNNASQPNQAEW